MGDDGLMGGTTTVDDLKITGNISTANSSIIGGKFEFFRVKPYAMQSSTNI